MNIVDTYGTVVGVVNPDAPYKVVIEAHADEISYFVHYITADGYIYLRRNRRRPPDRPFKRVDIYAKGIVKGVFGWPAIHTRTAGEGPDCEEHLPRCGRQRQERGGEDGHPRRVRSTYEDTFMVLNKDWYVAALDSRAGGFMIAEVARLLHEEGTKLPFGLYITNSVQEEIGLRGAQMIAERISPDVAIVTDVTHCTHTPMMNKIDNGDVAASKVQV